MIEEAGYGAAFVHRTGHSIGQETHGNGANMDNLETHDERLVLPRTCFSVEPGIYLPEFGVRSEVNVFVDADRPRPRHGRPPDRGRADPGSGGTESMTGLLGIALTVFLVGAVGLYLLLGVAIFVTHLVEKRPLKFLVPAPADDPEWSRLPSHARTHRVPSLPVSDNPYAAPGAANYAEAQNAAAESLGFVPSGLFAHAKGGTYRTHAVIWVSPTRETLAYVGWGTIASLNADKTILYSALDDGRFLVTSAKPTGAETPGLYENVVVMGTPSIAWSGATKSGSVNAAGASGCFRPKTR